MAGSIYDKALEGVDAANVTPGGVPGGDKYLRALEGVAAEPRQRAATNARVLSGTSTSQAASDRKLAAEVGAPEEVVASDRENFQAVATERRARVARASTSSSPPARRASNPTWPHSTRA